MDTSNWKWFRYDQIFNIETYRIGSNVLNSEKGGIPYIGASCTNNGITNYVNSGYPISANKITVSRNGSVCCAFYQSKEFVVSPDDIRIFTLQGRALNTFVAIFLCRLIEAERYRYAYGRKFGTGRMESQRIKLPINEDGNPDWQWIEDYVKKTLVPKLPQKAKLVWEKHFDKTPLSSNKLQLNTKEWKWFKIGDYFDKPYKATAYNAIELISCPKENKDSIAYITRTDTNNGCKDYVINEGFNDIENGNAITIGDTTATIYYQENDFICGDHMVVLRSSLLNKYVGLFITSLLNKERFRYNYGRAFNKGIISDTKLKLPAILNDQGEYEPDWQWMEDYIKGLPYSGCL